MKARWLIPLLLLTIFAAPRTVRAQEVRDVRLADQIANAVNTYTRYTIFDDIEASVENGHVVLGGKVTMPYKRSDIEKRVARIDGVRSLENRIEVLPVSIFDDDLRVSIARAIYRSPSFWNYAAMVNPPIHIVVDRGHVTLTGVVNSQVEKMLAQSLATGRGELGITNKLRTEM
jgi:osmotically-inducible protein OsmY